MSPVTLKVPLRIEARRVNLVCKDEPDCAYSDRDGPHESEEIHECAHGPFEHFVLHSRNPYVE